MYPPAYRVIPFVMVAAFGLASCGSDDSYQKKDAPYSQKIMRAHETALVMKPAADTSAAEVEDTIETNDSETVESNETAESSGDANGRGEVDENPVEETSQPSEVQNEPANTDAVVSPKATEKTGTTKRKPAEKQSKTDREGRKPKDGTTVQPRHKALLAGLTIFVLAIFVGFEVITKVPPTLHTPLMSGSNAISGITLVGAVTVTGIGTAISLAALTGFIAIILATINVVGGFLVTHRMLSMFKKR